MALTSTERGALIVAQAVAVEHGLILCDGQLTDARGAPWTVERYTSAVIAAVAAAARHVGAVDGKPSQARLRALLARLARSRASLGTNLLAGANVAYQEALRHAGVKISTRARGRGSQSRQRQVRDAIDAGEPLAPLMRHVGITEADLLHGAFETYRAEAHAAFVQFHDRQQSMIERAGLDPARFVAEGDIDGAVAFLSHGLLALVRQALVEGTVAPSMLAAARRKPIPSTPKAVRALERDRGPSQFHRPVVAAKPSAVRALEASRTPQPRVRVPAKLVTDSVRVADGRARAVLAESPDLLPSVYGLDFESTEEQLAAYMSGGGVLYEWAHGFYGEPDHPFEPHDALDGLQSTDPESDPQFLNTESFPDESYFAPQDHDGCTCELVPVEGA